ncbi:agamous-like MADS-box protein AGL75 [Mercurialis annua]|uniref:agamous-like MADS-box protein AGL75 n=1 Tax=Mercurialis annua TaxID=3986 RepID=UPI00215E09FB|nr:agamous-like MADS-box protein AGL75 [Mercurialis annua]
MAPRKENFMTKILRGDKQTQTASFLKRDPTLKKKALELQTLCDVSVIVLRFGPDGSVDIWPENESQVRDGVMRYKEFEQTRKKESNLFDFLEDKKAKLVKKKTRLMKTKLIHTLSKHVDRLSGRELTDFLDFLEEKLRNYQEKIASLAKEVESANQPQENCCKDCSNFSYGGSSTVTRTDDNNMFGGNSCLGAEQLMGDFNDLKFWWDGEIVQI